MYFSAQVSYLLSSSDGESHINDLRMLEPFAEWVHIQEITIVQYVGHVAHITWTRVDGDDDEIEGPKQRKQESPSNRKVERIRGKLQKEVEHSEKRGRWDSCGGGERGRGTSWAKLPLSFC